jgi:hypothetical protein
MTENLDTLWGIDRDRRSPAYGELVCPVILMWDAPAAEKLGQVGLTGAMGHGSVVRVTARAAVAGLVYYYCEAEVVTETEVYPQAGWVRATLLKDRGASEYEGGQGHELPASSN